MSGYAGVSVVRHGTALAVVTAAGHTRVLRQIDLAGVLGARPLAPAPWPDRLRIARRFESAAIASAGIEVRYQDGARETLPAAYLDELLSGASGRRADLVIENAGLVVTAETAGSDPLGVIEHGAVIMGRERILWVGPTGAVARAGHDLAGATRIDAGGRLVTPGLVDCHAHPMFGGNRADEYARRAMGQTYQEIAAAGGGITATLQPTRAASLDQHIALTGDRMARALAAGTTTCEAKSGYDLTVDGELRLLEVALAVDALQPVDLSPTLLGAHVLPPEYAEDRAGYVALVADEMVPRAAARGLATAVDVYCDEGAFTVDEARAILTAAREAGLHVRAHVGQFSDLGCAQLIAELGGLSADHLEVVSDDGIAAMAAHGVVGVMLPGACVQVRAAPPPVARLRAAGVALAVASDLNPGTSFCENLPVQMWLATTHYGMTVAEAWLGVTRMAARAMGRHDIGSLTPGALADAVIWDAELPGEIPYRYGANLVHKVIKRGRCVIG